MAEEWDQGRGGLKRIKGRSKKEYGETADVAGRRKKEEEVTDGDAYSHRA